MTAYILAMSQHESAMLTGQLLEAIVELKVVTESGVTDQLDRFDQSEPKKPLTNELAV